MERLTEWIDENKAVPKMDMKRNGHQRCMNKLAKLEDMEEQSKLLILPCKLGDVLYTNMRVQGWYMRSSRAPYEVKVAFIGINGKNNFFNVVYENQNMWQFEFSDIGKTVFLTEQEAKEALEGMKND